MIVKCPFCGHKYERPHDGYREDGECPKCQK